jgi:hypothetical protein
LRSTHDGDALCLDRTESCSAHLRIPRWSIRPAVCHHVLPTSYGGTWVRIIDVASSRARPMRAPCGSLHCVMLCHHFLSDCYCATPGFLSVWTCGRLGMVQPPIPVSHLLHAERSSRRHAGDLPGGGRSVGGSRCQASRSLVCLGLRAHVMDDSRRAADLRFGYGVVE